jgi:hypothetical protein
MRTGIRPVLSLPTGLKCTVENRERHMRKTFLNTRFFEVSWELNSWSLRDAGMVTR